MKKEVTRTSVISQLGILTYYILLGVILVLVGRYIYTKISNRVQNPPSKIYGEKQELDTWHSQCSEWYDEDNCESYLEYIRTKSYIITDNDTIPVVARIEISEAFDYLEIKLEDWKNGDDVYPYPQEKSWYRFFDSYESYETYLDFKTLKDSSENHSYYEVLVCRESILVTTESCDNRGPEKEIEGVKGGCFLLAEYRYLVNDFNVAELKLSDGRKLVLIL